MDSEIESFVSRVRGRRDKDATVNNRVRAIEDFGEWLAERDTPVSEIDRNDLTDYFPDLGSRDLSPKDVDNRKWSINVFLNEMVGRDVLEENPMDNVDWDKYRNLFNGTKKEDYVDAKGGIYALEESGVDKVANATNNFRDEFVIRLMYHTGIRASTLCHIKIDDVDRENREIEIYIPKLDSDWIESLEPRQKVWYGSSLDSYFRRWLDFGARDQYGPAEDSPYLFVTGRAEQLNVGTINRWVREAADEAGLQEVMYVDNNGNDRHLVTSHTLRHSFARSCMVGNNGGRIDLKTLADLMNHSDTTTTEKYLHFAEDDLREARQMYGPR